MAGLRTLLELDAGGGQTLDFTTFHVYNTNKTNANNGGQCCLFTVPAGVNWFAVEVWGGGGGGAGACCCHQGWAGGSGSYARKFITGLSGTGGETYTICAASSTNCSQSRCVGCQGFPSFVSVNGGAIEACASGGAQGYTRCYFGSNCSYSGCAQFQCGSWVGGFGICGVTGSAKGSSYCYQMSWQYMPSAPFTGGGNRGTMSHCVQGPGCSVGGYAHWPGGGGPSASAHGGNYCGGPGAGGLVSVYYPTVVEP